MGARSTLGRSDRRNPAGNGRARGWTAVVGHDGSSAAREPLAHAARRTGRHGHLIVVHALPLGVRVTHPECGRAYEQMARKILRSIQAAVPEGVSYETRIVAGPASTALIDAARRCGADEIVLGSSSSRAALGAVGRVADKVLRHTNLPVTIVPAPA